MSRPFLFLPIPNSLGDPPSLQKQPRRKTRHQTPPPRDLHINGEAPPQKLTPPNPIPARPTGPIRSTRLASVVTYYSSPPTVQSSPSCRIHIRETAWCESQNRHQAGFLATLFHKILARAQNLVAPFVNKTPITPPYKPRSTAQPATLPSVTSSPLNSRLL